MYHLIWLRWASSVIISLSLYSWQRKVPIIFLVDAAHQLIKQQQTLVGILEIYWLCACVTTVFGLLLCVFRYYVAPVKVVSTIFCLIRYELLRNMGRMVRSVGIICYIYWDHCGISDAPPSESIIIVVLKLMVSIMCSIAFFRDICVVWYFEALKQMLYESVPKWILREFIQNYSFNSALTVL